MEKTVNAAGAPAAEVSALIRATLFVRDLQRATTFYRELGLRETFLDAVLEDPSASAVIGLDTHRPYPARILKRPGPNFGMLGLFQLSPEQGAEEVAAISGPARIGEIALVFYVSSLAATLARLERAGGTLLRPVQAFRLGGMAVSEACIRDCDGNLLSLIERDPMLQNNTGPAVIPQAG
ncbi:VOC family protein [Haliea sp. E17]|uniref:VOC family protein n=1 Tax=Haliea sp. E17 TaxID=3401576 RepID=UPI003AABA18F